MIGAAEISFYNHAYVEAFNSKFESGVVSACQKFGRTSGKQLTRKTCFVDIYRS